LKVVLFSDLHLDAPFRWAPPSLGRRLRLALRETLQRICQLAVDAEVDALLCAGDLYEQESFTPDTANFLRSSFADLAPIRVFVAPGNHDWYGPESLYRQVSWSSNVHVFSESRLTAARMTDGFALWGAAHRAPANTDDFLVGFHANDGTQNVALFHGSEHGFLLEQGTGKTPHAPFSEAEIPESGLLHAFVGHYHQPRDGRWLTYAGSPQALAFGEGAGSAVVIEIADGEVRRSRVDVSTMKFNDVAVDVSGAASMNEIFERVRISLAGLRGVARVTLSGALNTDVDIRLDDVRTLATDLDGLVVRTMELHPAYDLDVIAREQTVRGQFVRDVQASGMPDDERERVLTVGLRALDGRSDLEPV
jgi:exonuclease SbcD